MDGDAGSFLLLVPVFLEDEAKSKVVGEGGFCRTAVPADGELGGGFLVGVDPDAAAPALSLERRARGGETRAPTDVVGGEANCASLLFGSLFR